MTGILILQMLIGAVTVLLTLAVGRLAFTPKIGFAGALVTALLPILPFFETQLLAETWTTALTVGSLVLVLRVVKGRSASTGRTLFFAGLLLGIAALGRPNLMLLVVAIAVWLWWQGRSGGLPRPGLGSMGLLLAGFLLAISPATIHNLKYGEFTLISANLGANLVAGNSDEADGVSAIPVGVRWDDLQLQTRLAGAGSPAAASRFLSGRAMAWIASHPAEALQLVGKKILLLVNAHEGRNNINPLWFAREEGVFLLARWWPATWLVLPLAVLGLMRFRHWRPGSSLLAWAILVQAVAVLPFFVNARFRLPLMPLLALFAAAGVASLIGHWQTRDRRSLGFGLAVAIGMFGIVNVDWFGLGAERWLARDWFNQGLIQARPYGDRQPDPRLAEQNFRRAVTLAPAEVDFCERLGASLLGQAQPWINAAAASTDNRDWARAAAALDRAEPLVNEAREQHRRAVEVFPRSFRSWSNLGVSAKWLGDVRSDRMAAALARGDSASGRQSALAALELYKYSVQEYQKGLEINPGLDESKRSINEVFRTVMDLPELDPTIVEFQRRAAVSIRNRGQGRR